MKQTAEALNWSLEQELMNPTTTSLQQRIFADGTVDLVHFMGHGDFDPQEGVGRLALCDERGETRWVPDRQLARIVVCDGQAPRAVVLHACEGGKADFPISFAGVAAQLVRAGVPNVVAMQYPVTNSTASRFSTSLYESIGLGADLDAAVQTAREEIVSGEWDPRLLGVPVLYSQQPEKLFTLGDDE
jgi:CHAT domain-containing protein